VAAARPGNTKKKKKKTNYERNRFVQKDKEKVEKSFAMAASS
jgi:hypothetical protein